MEKLIDLNVYFPAHHQHEIIIRKNVYYLKTKISSFSN
jgi:hypothetical protein